MSPLIRRLTGDLSALEAPCFRIRRLFEFAKRFPVMFGLDGDGRVEHQARILFGAQQAIPETVQFDRFLSRPDVEVVSALVSLGRRIGSIHQRGTMEGLVDVTQQMDQPAQVGSASRRRYTVISQDVFTLLYPVQDVVVGRGTGKYRVPRGLQWVVHEMPLGMVIWVAAPPNVVRPCARPHEDVMTEIHARVLSR